MSYSCEICDYHTDDSSNFCKHKKTKKHNEKVISLKATPPKAPKRGNLPQIGAVGAKISTVNPRCEGCGKEFSKTYNLHRHINEGRCKGTSHKLRELEEELRIRDMRYRSELEKKELEARLQVKDAQLEAARKAEKEKTEFIMSGKAGNVYNYNNNKTSIRNFVESHYPDAPPLECLNLDKMNTLGKEEEDMSLVEVLIHNHNKKQLANYVGDFIVRHYKKKNPSKQSVWTSDTSRLNYIVKEIMSNNSQWSPDKKGLKTREYIIVPILEHIKIHLVDFIKDTSAEACKLGDINKQVKWFDMISSAYKIQTSIEDGNLAEGVIKYVAPHFYLNTVDIRDQIVEDINSSEEEGYTGSYKLLDHDDES